MFVQLGFTVNYEKSHLIPSQRIGVLGFIFYSIKMIIELPQEKISKLHNTIIKLINTTHPTILQITQVLGVLVAYSEAIQYGLLFYHSLEMDKNT